MTLGAVNFRLQAVTCVLRSELAAAGITPDETLHPRELLAGAPLPACSGAELAAGYMVSIPARDGVVIKLR